MTDTLVRAEGYRLLALCLRYPNPEELHEELEAAGAAPEPLTRFAALADDVDTELPGEFNRLFATSVAVPPYETSWVRADKGARLGQLAALYNAFGARAGGAEREHSDHVGAQLEFAALACLKEALAHGDEQQEVSRAAHRIVVSEHLGKWMPLFTETLGERSPHPFYRKVADALAAWVAEDLADHGWQADASGAGAEAGEDACLTCPMHKPDTGSEAVDEAAELPPEFRTRAGPE
jgi:TorA maturation chaperone TorD